MRTSSRKNKLNAAAVALPSLRLLLWRLLSIIIGGRGRNVRAMHIGATAAAGVEGV